MCGSVITVAVKKCFSIVSCKHYTCYDVCLVMSTIWVTPHRLQPPSGRPYCDRCVAANRKESGTFCRLFARCSAGMIQTRSPCWTSSLKNCWPATRSAADHELTLNVPLILDTHCCHIGTGIKHPVPDRVKPSFVIFDIRAPWHAALPRCQKLQITA